MSFYACSPRMTRIQYGCWWPSSVEHTSYPQALCHRLRLNHGRNLKRRCMASYAEATERQDELSQLGHGSGYYLANRARRKQAEKDFIVDILSSAATKRDARAYLSRVQSPQKQLMPNKISRPPRNDRPLLSTPQVNVGNLFGRAKAVDESPVFTQDVQADQASAHELGTLHVALVKLKGLEALDSHVVHGIAQTLSQLAKLGITPCVVLEASTRSTSQKDRRILTEQADQLIALLENHESISAWKMDSILSITADSENVQVDLRNILLRALRKGRVPVVLPFAISATDQASIVVSANDVLLALTTEFAGLSIKFSAEDDPLEVARKSQILQKQVSLDRVILIDAAGGFPSARTEDSRHMFVNMEQEYEELLHDLTASADVQRGQHLSNLQLLRNLLQLLPPSSSALITTPTEAANVATVNPKASDVAGVGTRRQKNLLIYNLLTDKPAYSSSLPSRRLARSPVISPITSTTFVKKGMPLTILPDASDRPWTPHNYGQPVLKLTDSRVDLPRLVHLIDDSFNRELDVEQYLRRVNDRIAGIIIAGEYEGCALLTWETPPGASSHNSPRLVPYLDKFAVLKRSQGAGSVADILFNAMVRTCLPHGVCWRSRKDNPVNKWYFERSRGTWKIPDMNWTMFWTTPNVFEGGQTFLDYAGVCRGVVPTWKDQKSAAD